MKKNLIVVLVLFVSIAAFAQQQELNKATLNFHQAMRRLDINEMDKLLKKNKDKIDLKGFPYLANDVGIADIKITKFLIEKGADVNAQTENGDTPLIFAIMYKKYDVVNLLLENGAKKTINAKGTEGKTALSRALDNCLRFAISKEDYLMIAKLLENGADINQSNNATFVFNNILHRNDDYGYDLAELFLNNGINLEVDQSGMLLSTARGYERPNIKLIKLLLAHGIKPGYDVDSFNLLHEICRSQKPQDYDILELFINNGLDVNSYTNESSSLLITTLNSKSFNKAELLVNNKAIVNCIVAGTTPLIIAVKNGAPADMIKKLLDNGADPNTVEVVSKKSALDYAKNRGDNTIINLIQERI